MRWPENAVDPTNGRAALEDPADQPPADDDHKECGGGDRNQPAEIPLLAFGPVPQAAAHHADRLDATLDRPRAVLGHSPPRDATGELAQMSGRLAPPDARPAHDRK